MPDAGAAATLASFSYTGSPQSWTVPPGVTEIQVIADGAGGGGDTADTPDPTTGALPVGGPLSVAGLGSQVVADLAVTPGEVLVIRVGGKGADGTGVGGYNGGGGGGSVSDSGTVSGGGGGATDIAPSSGNVAIVAAGGGGAGGSATLTSGQGGSGGGLNSAAEAGEGGIVNGPPGAFAGGGGGGASQSAGGAGGSSSAGENGSSGSAGSGGGGGGGCRSDSGGGGGGGYFGGGGGGGGCYGGAGGGAGGSSYVDLTQGSVVQVVPGFSAGDGSLVITTPGAATGSGPLTATTFTFNGGTQAYTVPSGVDKLQVNALGGSGGGGASGSGEQATVPVAAGQLVIVNAGGEGALPGNGATVFNGGGSSGTGGSGGGGSDVRLGGVQPGDRYVVGGGGGGDGVGNGSGKGGAAGFPQGTAGTDATAMGGLPGYAIGDGGGGGTQSAGGAAGDQVAPPGGGAYGENGASGGAGYGGSGGSSCRGTDGGGGGGGYFGGGGGGAGCYGGSGGGGGGSDYASPATSGAATSGATQGPGQVSITPVAAPAPSGGGGSSGGGSSGGGSTSGCAYTNVSIGQLGAIGCFSRNGSIYSAKGSVALNGLEFIPLSGGAIELDTALRQLVATGTGEIMLGPLHLPSVITAPLSLHPGPIPLKGWKHGFVLPLDSPGQPFTLAQTPPGYNHFLGLGMAHLTVTFDDAQGAHVRGAVLFGTLLGTSLASGSFDLHTDNAHGIALERLCVGMGNPSVSGQSLVLAFELFHIKSGLLCYQPTSRLLTGFVTIVPDPESRTQIVAELILRVPDLSSVSAFRRTAPAVFGGLGAGVANINKPLDYGFYLQRLGFELHLQPHVGLTGSVGISWLPQLASLSFGGKSLNILGKKLSKIPLGGLELFSIDGSMSVTFGGDNGFDNIFFPNSRTDTFADSGRNAHSTTVYVDGLIRMLGGIRLAHGRLTYRTHGLSTFSGRAVALPVAPGFTVTNAVLNGSFEGGHFQALGTARVSVGFLGMGQAAVVVSDKGFGVCATRLGVGFKFYVFHPHFVTFWGCDFGDLFTVTPAHPSAARAAAAGTVPFKLRPGLRSEEIAVRGGSGPPLVTLHAPDGASFRAPQAVGHAMLGHGVFSFREDNTRTTYFVIAHPSAGVWRVTPQSGQSADYSVERADPLPAASVHARVDTRGGRFTLTWRLRRIAGQLVIFREQAPSASGEIVETAAATGRIVFHPAPGLAGERQIVAIIEQNGLPRAERTVAVYHAPAAPRLRAPLFVTLRRVARGTVLSWAPVLGARAYDVEVRLEDGMGGMVIQLAPRHRVMLPGQIRSARVRATAPTAFSSSFVRARTASKRAPTHHRSAPSFTG